MFFYDSTFVILIPAIIFTLFADMQVKGKFKQYSQISNSRGLTGAEAARRVLSYNGINDVRVERVAGSMTDHYDPRKKVLRLSDTVFDSTSVAAIGVACHEVGHAIQHNRGYAPLVIRNTIVPAVNFASMLSVPMAILGIILLSSGGIGDLLFNVGVLLFIVVIAFHTITLPVEFNASNRAIKQIEELNLLEGRDLVGAKKVLNAAAMTYVAALATSIANLLRLLAIRGRD